MIGLICATEYEANYIVSNFGLELVVDSKYHKIYTNEELVLLVSGIGKILSSIGVSCLMQKYDCKYIINIWVVWACKFDYKIWDIVLPTQVMQYDVEIPFRNKYTNLIYSPLFINLALELEDEELLICASWDKVLNMEKKKNLWDKLWIDIIDMELFAIASYMDSIGTLDKLISIKAVSDGLGIDYKLENLQYAMSNMVKKLEELIKNLE